MPYLLRDNLYGRKALSKPRDNKLILDIVTGASIAYGLRKLKSGYTGNCIKVRRDNDNEELDIGFNGNSLDTTALSTFVGVNTAYVTTWYDQSGNNVNAVQAPTARQPRVVNAGSYEEGVNFLGGTGADKGVLNAGKVFNNKVDYSVFANIKPISNANSGQIYCKGTDLGHGLYLRAAINKLRLIEIRSVTIGAWDGATELTYNTSVKYIYTNVPTIYKNGEKETPDGANAAGDRLVDAGQDLLIGQWRSYDGSLDGLIHEIIFFDKILNATDASNLNAL